MINAVYNGTTYNDVHQIEASDGDNTATVTLSESGTIPTPTGTINIVADGTYDVTDKATAVVAVGGGATLQTKSVTLASTSETITPDVGYDGLSSVSVNAPIQASKNVTPDGTTQTITPDAGYLGLAQVVVAPGGGGSALTGSFTPESDVLTYTIADLINTDKEHILIYAYGGVSIALEENVRTIGCAFIDFDSVSPCYWGIASNASGNNMTGVAKGNTAGASNYLAFDRTTGTLTFANSANSGYLKGGVTYEWIAW